MFLMVSLSLYITILTFEIFFTNFGDQSISLCHEMHIHKNVLVHLILYNKIRKMILRKKF